MARKGKLPVKQAIIFLFGLLFIIALIVSLATSDDLFHTGGPEGGDVASERLAVHFIDVGQGDAILIRTPTQNILIDGGERGEAVVDYLQARGIGSLDLVIGTHPHQDHIGGLVGVLKQIPVKEVIDPGVAHTSQTYENNLTIIDEKDIKFTAGRAGMTRNLGGGATMKILHPDSPSRHDLNNASIVVKIDFGRVSFLLTGDAGSEAEKEMRGRVYNLRSTVLKVGHHGSSSSTSREFLNAVRPKVAVISVGTANAYDHPHDETLQNLANAGADIFRTDLQGTIIITTDGTTYSANKKPCASQPPPVFTFNLNGNWAQPSSPD